MKHAPRLREIIDIAPMRDALRRAYELQLQGIINRLQKRPHCTHAAEMRAHRDRLCYLLSDTAQMTAIARQKVRENLTSRSQGIALA